MDTAVEVTPQELLHELVDKLNRDDAYAALKYVQYLMVDPVEYAHRNAPIDDEPETEEEKQRVAEANAEYERGEYVTLEKVREELGL